MELESNSELDPEVPVQVMIDGPYGGCSLDLGEYESILLFSGGGGATFTIGLLDDIVGRCVRLRRAGGEKTQRIEFAWCIQSFGEFSFTRLLFCFATHRSCSRIIGSIKWFTPFLMDIANTAAGSSVDLHISIFVTCLCDPEAVPAIPNSEVTVERPSARSLLETLLNPDDTSTSRSDSPDVNYSADREKNDMAGKLKWAGLGGGVGVCASGPESLTREAANAVARLGMMRGMELGGIALHSEVFSM